MSYRDRRGRFIPRWLWEESWLLTTGTVPRRRQSASLSIEEYEELRSAIEPEDYPEPEESKDPAGTEYELTATTAGGTPRGKGTAMLDPRVLHLKIRVTSDHPMTATMASLLLDRMVRTRQDVPGISVQAIDWAKGWQDGDGLDRHSVRYNLRAFYGAIQAGDPRFARVSL